MGANINHNQVHARGVTALGRIVQAAQGHSEWVESLQVNSSYISKMCCMLVAQTARDLVAVTEIEPGMTKHQIITRKENLASKNDALQWIQAPSGRGAVTLEDCCAIFNLQLGEEQFHVQALRKKMLEQPEAIANSLDELGISDERRQLAS